MTRRFDDVAHDTPLRAYAACLALALALVCGWPAAASATIPLPAQYSSCQVGSDNVTPNCAVPSPDTPSCTKTTSVMQCFIWEPAVTVPSRSYGSVALMPGDDAQLYANGCAQAGGSGSTWHRYVDPHDNTHFGSASILTDLPMTRFSALGDAVHVHVQASESLALYYNDDNLGAFGNNGYWGWDSGDAGECDEGAGRTAFLNDRYGGPAYIYVSVAHDTKSPSISLGTPGSKATYGLGDDVSAQYSCTPSVSWVKMTACAATINGSPVANGASIDTSSVGDKTVSVTATDSAGRTNTVTAGYTVTDRTRPAVSITSPADNATYTLGQNAAAGYSCADQAGGSGLASCTGDVASGMPIDTATVGVKSFTVRARDGAGNETIVVHHYTVGDATAPIVSVRAPQDGATYGQGQGPAANFDCADEQGGSGLAGCAGSVAAGQQIDTTTLGTKAFTVTAADRAGNQTTRTVHYTVIDVTAPTISIAAPSGAVFTRGEHVAVSYHCDDEPGGSGLAQCAGDVANGAALDTSKPGVSTFAVHAVDAAGNTAAASVAFTVLDYPRLDATAFLKYRDGKNGSIVVAQLLAVRVPAGARITVRCRGRGCPTRTTAIGVNHRQATLDLKAWRKRQLARGAVLTIDMTKPQTIGNRVVFDVRKNHNIAKGELCLPPGGKAQACPVG